MKHKSCYFFHYLYFRPKTIPISDRRDASTNKRLLRATTNIFLLRLCIDCDNWSRYILRKCQWIQPNPSIGVWMGVKFRKRETERQIVKNASMAQCSRVVYELCTVTGCFIAERNLHEGVLSSSTVTHGSSISDSHCTPSVLQRVQCHATQPLNIWSRPPASARLSAPRSLIYVFCDLPECILQRNRNRSARPAKWCWPLVLGAPGSQNFFNVKRDLSKPYWIV